MSIVVTLKTLFLFHHSLWLKVLTKEDHNMKVYDLSSNHVDVAWFGRYDMNIHQSL